MNELGLMFGFDLSLSMVYVRRGYSIVVMFSFLMGFLFFSVVMFINLFLTR